MLAQLGADEAVAYGRSPVALPGRTLRILDLDRESLRLQEPMPPRLLYTVPPPVSDQGDPRLARFLAVLKPAPKRLVYISTSGVYGDCKGELVSESRPPAPGTARAMRRFAAEQLVHGWCSKSGVACSILRVPAIYGPGRLGVDRISAGEPQILESEANPGNRIHVDDLAAAAIAALGRSTPGGIYNIGDGDFRSSTWFALTVARLAGLTAPPLISRAEALATLPASRLSFLQESRRLDTRKMHEVLGVRLRYANAEIGIRDSLRKEGQRPD
ncbi:MAG: NAD-dependent epimerase/dehydratase family protein [Woeseiaceae bacterium]|nr:NAD-dependent epimerase/dehydratase family protein [Woeseiaceae bacterium]